MPSASGDTGETSLIGGPRVAKDIQRIQCLGAVEELNAFIGLARSSAPNAVDTEALLAIQRDLFRVGAQLAVGDPARAAASGRITGGDVRRLELLIESKRGLLDGSVRFIVPGSCPEAARLHVATAVCRRAEREVVRLSHAETVSPELLSYINRLSDALHALARASETDPIDVGK